MSVLYCTVLYCTVVYCAVLYFQVYVVSLAHVYKLETVHGLLVLGLVQVSIKCTVKELGMCSDIHMQNMDMRLKG
jgi:hypothetical protein